MGSFFRYPPVTKPQRQYISHDLAGLAPIGESSVFPDQPPCCKYADSSFFELSKQWKQQEGKVVLKCLNNALVRHTQSQQLHKRHTYLPYAFWDIRNHRCTDAVPWRRVLPRTKRKPRVANRKPRNPQKAAAHERCVGACGHNNGRGSFAATEEAKHQH